MKKYWQGFVLFLCSVLAISIAQAQPKVEKLWQVEGLRVPESVLYYQDPKSTYLLVSQIDGDPSALDGQGGIAKMTVNGEVFAPDWVTGLNAPKGMAILAGLLFVADVNQVVVINLKNGDIDKRIAIAGAQFLNDVAVDIRAGVIYVSDTKTNKIHRIKNGVVEDYLDKVESANGLAILNGNLVIGSNTQLLLVDKDKNRLQLAKGFAQAIDGVEPVSRGDFIVSCWPGLIYYVHVDGKMDLLLDTQQAKINTADIGYDVVNQTIFVPNFLSNTVTAYRLIK